MKFYIFFILLVIMIISYMVMNKKKPNRVSYKNKYKENSIKISKKGFNDTRYIYGFEYVSGNEISLLKEFNISDDLIKLYLELRPNEEIEISELGVGFDGDKEIKKVYYLEKDKDYGYGVKSDGKKTIYSKYTHRNDIKYDLNKYLFDIHDTKFIINTLILDPDVKYYLKSDFLNKNDTDNESNQLTNSVHIAYYDRHQPIESSKDLINNLCERFKLPTLDENWFNENKSSLIDYIAFTKNLNNDIDITIYYTKKD